MHAMTVPTLGQQPDEAGSREDACCCDCCNDCCCCSCHNPHSQAHAKKWQIVDVSLSTLTLGACGWYLQWYFMRNLWVFFAGAIFLAVSCMGAITSSSLGICTMNRQRAAYLGGLGWAGCALVASCLIAIAPPFTCQKSRCRQRPEWCFVWEADYHSTFHSHPMPEFSVSHASHDQNVRRGLFEKKVLPSVDDSPSDDYIYDHDYWYDELWNDDFYYDDFFSWYGNYYYVDDWEEQHRYDSYDDYGDDDFFKYDCNSMYCSYHHHSGEHMLGDVCYKTGYQSCTHKFGSRLELSFSTGHDFWHGFDKRDSCDRFFVLEMVLAKLPLLFAAMGLLLVRWRVARFTRSALHEFECRLVTELASTMHIGRPQLGNDPVSDDSTVIQNPPQQYKLLADDAAETFSTTTTVTSEPHQYQLVANDATGTLFTRGHKTGFR